jgi:hypothetical protein
MANSDSATRLAIARLTGADLPAFVPAAIADEVAVLVRECILQPTTTSTIKVTTKVREEISDHLKRHKTPKYTIAQYLTMVLCTVSTTSDLIDQHDRGLISDKEFIKQIKNDKNRSRAKVPSKMGRKKAGANASDREIFPREVHKGTRTKVS